MNERVIELLAEAVELLRQQQQQQQEQQQRRVRKVARMLDIVARLPLDFVEVEDGFAYITYDGRQRVKVVLPKDLRGAKLEDLRGTFFAFSVDLMECSNGRRFTSIRGRPIDQEEAKKRLTLRVEMVSALAEEISTLPGISWCGAGIKKVLSQMAIDWKKEVQP